MFEGWLDHSDKDSAGLIIWMSQSAYPSLVWQTFDYYYDLNGAYWGAKTACEPVHVYWNESDDRIRVVNTSGRNVDGLVAEAAIYNLDGSQKFEHKSDPFSSKPDAVADCFPLAYPNDLTPTHFIRLRLTDRAGKLVSENFYWRGTEHLNFAALDTLKKVDLGVNAHLSQENGETVVSAVVTNPGSSQNGRFCHPSDARQTRHRRADPAGSYERRLLLAAARGAQAGHFPARFRPRRERSAAGPSRVLQQFREVRIHDAGSK